MRQIVRCLGIAIVLVVTSFAAASAQPHVSREDIEWLDVWLPHVNDLDKPHVLLIGDSITRGYYPTVEAKLADRAYVGRLSTSKSLGDPALLAEVSLVLHSGHYQVIHFNNGLHGKGYSEVEYARALPKLIALLKSAAPNARLIWANSTSMLEKAQADHPSNARIKERNRLAAACVSRYGINIDDLSVIADQHPEYHVPDGVHFTDEGYNALGSQVAEAIRTELLRGAPGT